MAIKAVALMLIMTLMVSTFAIESNAFDLADSGRSLLRLRFLTDEATPVGVTTATASAPSAEATVPSGNGEKKDQTWVSWFNNMFTGSSSNGAPASAPSA